MQLYDVNKTKLDLKKEYKDLQIESVLSTGDKTLSFLYPKNLAKDFKNEAYIRTKTDEYVIKSVSSQADYKAIKAVLNLEDLEGKVWESFSSLEATISNCLSLACANTGWTVEVTGVTKKRTIRMTNCSSWEIIQQARKTYLVEMKFDTINKKIIVKETLGSDKGTYFTESLNLKRLDIENDSFDFYTRLIPVGKDGLKINVNGKDYLENYQYSSKVKTIIWKDERYTNVNSLIEDGTAKLNELSKPRVAYAIEILDLAKAQEDYKNILSYEVGDTIYLISKENDLKVKQRIVKTIEYPDEPHRNSCEIANTIFSFEDMQKEYQDAVDTLDNITSDNGTISESAIAEPVRILTVNKVETDVFNALEGRVGTLEVNKLNVDVANIQFANINKALIDKANITDLTAINIKFDVGQGGTLNLQTLLSNFITGNSGQFLNLTGANTVFENAIIKDVMIDTVNASKLNAGAINTNLVEIKGASGNLSIKDNTIQIKDSNRVRVQIGKDASNDYNMYVWDSSGKLMFDATGLKADGIKSKIIRDDMVSDTANINGSKLNISSVITAINNDNTTTLKSSKVLLDTEKQSLEVAFNSLKTNVDLKETRNLILNSDFQKDFSSWVRSGGISEVLEENSEKTLRLYANNTSGNRGISQIFEVGKTIPNGNYTLSLDIKKGSLQGNFQYYIWYLDKDNINIGGLNKKIAIANEYQRVSSTFQVPNNANIKSLRLFIYCEEYIPTELFIKKIKVEKGINVNPTYSKAPEDIEEKITANTTQLNIHQGNINTLIADNSIIKGDITTINTDYSKINQTVNSISQTVASHTTSISGLTNKVSTAESNITQLNSKIALKVESSDFEETIDSINSRLESAELKITDSAIISTVSSTVNTAKTEAINSANSSTDNKLKNYSTTTQMNTAITQSANSITSTVSSTYATKEALGTETTRINAVENKITATALTTTISTGLAGSNSISNTKFTMNKDGLTIKNGGLKIQNNAGTTVLNADSNGNLIVTASISASTITGGTISGTKLTGVDVTSKSFTAEQEIKLNAGAYSPQITFNNYPEGVSGASLTAMGHIYVNSSGDMFLQSYNNNRNIYVEGKLQVDNASVVASYTNANGTWVRFYDGTQICYGEHIFSETSLNMTNKIQDGVYGAQSVNLTFPATFIESPKVTVSAATNGYINSMATSIITTNFIIRAWLNYSASVSSLRATWIAVGRWK